MLIPRKEAKRRWRDAVLLRSDYCCSYCNEQLGPRSATLDHIIPKSKGGHGVKNLVVACHGCNNAKGDMMPEEWAAVLAIRKARIARWKLRYGRRDLLLEDVAAKAPTEAETPKPNHGRIHMPKRKRHIGLGCIR